jgi:hypothetical protein
MSQTKECAKCKQTKATSEFYRRKYKTGYKPASYCKKCHRDEARHREKLPSTRSRASNFYRRWHLRTKYGLSEAQYARIKAGQGHGCAICGGVSTRKCKYRRWYDLAVDHDHDTGKVRGLLCDNCNRAIGLMKDDVSVLRKAITYLERHNARVEV